MNVLDPYMWDYQQHFQISLQYTAESLFNQIDAKLKPTVSMVGFLIDDLPRKKSIYIEPENSAYSINDFSSMFEFIHTLEKTSKLKHSNGNKRSTKNTNKIYVEAISQIVLSKNSQDTEKFISNPSYVEGFLVFVILEIQKKAFKSHYSLTKDKWLDDRFKISRSFIESTIYTYLKECTNALRDPNNPINVIERPTDELLRESGKKLMGSISLVGGGIDGLHLLYHACNSISSMKYEGAEGLGKMIIAKKDHPNVHFTLQLEEPIRISDFRKVRKFLELSNDTSFIISDASWIYGLGNQKGKYNPKTESLFVINFISHHKWEVLHDKKSLMIVEFTQPNIHKERIDKDVFYLNIRRVFKNISQNQIDNLWNITIEAVNQKHGTMLVISDNAKEEAARLVKQSFSLKPLKLKAEIIHQITSIDGSVLLDRDSVCHAIGVILDGIATDKGDSSRGARYNSSIRYYEYIAGKYPTVIVIISEDGMVNLIPNPKPKIKHATITEAINSLKKLSEQEKSQRKDFNKLMTLFEDVEFYLTEEECNIINHLKNKIDENDKDAGGIHTVHNDLKPNCEMDESYYLDV